MERISLSNRLIWMILGLCFSGCSSFEKAWEEAGKVPAAGQGIVGRWQGTWLSVVNHHSGALRCILGQEPDGRYLARYHATYAGTFTFTYDVHMVAESVGDIWKFRGSANLGWLVGTYEYEGEVKGSEFVSAYTSSSDRGTFRMTRIESMISPGHR